jgi:hypothetical protein
MTGDSVRRRHVWVDSVGGHRSPGLVIAWRRRTGGAEWEAYVAQAHDDGAVLVAWVPAANLHPRSLLN